MARFLLEPSRSAVLLDLDGTLADTDPLHAEAWARTVHELTGKVIDPADYLRCCVRGNLTPLEYVARLGVDAPRAQLTRRKAAHYTQLVAESLELREGATTFVTALQSAGIALGLVSNSSLRSMETFVEHRWPGPPPDTVVSRSDEVRRKPDPGPYVLALRRLHRVPASSLAIENSPQGIEAALGAGLGCIAILSSDFSHCELTRADVVMAAFTSIVVARRPDGVEVDVVAVAGDAGG
jgi:HAD superfamily hydrolase (TIGR01509 family)